MSGCIFKTIYDCQWCHARKVIEKAYCNNKEVDYKRENGLTKVYIYPKENKCPTSPQLKYKNKFCTCEE